MIKVGEEAPDFQERTTLGRGVWLRNLRGRVVILTFFAPGSTAEAGAFRAEYDGMRGLGAEVLGLSPDDFEAQCRVAAELEVKLPLISDTAGRIAASYGVSLVPGVGRRVSVVVGPHGLVEAVFDGASGPEQHVAELVRFLRARRAGSAADLGERESRAPGEVIAGRYLLQSRLAEGGIGEVWRAEHVHLKQQLAIKLLKDDTTQDPAWIASVLERFRFEAQVSAMLAKKTNHVVAVVDAGDCEAGPFLAMEFIAGKTLLDELDERGPSDPDRFGRVLEQVVDALTAAHAAGVVHRDLKPSNILVQEVTARADVTGPMSLAALRGGPFVKVADFGIAKTAEGALGLDRPKDTAVTVLVGTPDYMSPEQLRGGEKPDPRMDVWALGVVSYQMLTGFMPFEAASTTALMVEVLVRPFVAATKRRPELPRGLDAWFDRALAKKASDRFTTALEMLEAYRDVVPCAEGLPGAGPSGRRSSASSLPRIIAPTGTAPPTSVPSSPVAVAASPVTGASRPRIVPIAALAMLVAVVTAIAAGWLLLSRAPDAGPDLASSGASAAAAAVPPPLASPAPSASPTLAPSPSATPALASAVPSGTVSARRRPPPPPRSTARAKPPPRPGGHDPSSVF
jgi:eukaryotic-like serine/threonine-protein kinase